MKVTVPSFPSMKVTVPFGCAVGDSHFPVAALERETRRMKVTVPGQRADSKKRT